MRRRLALGLAFVLTTLAGVASASVLSAGQAAEAPGVADDAAVPGSARLGVTVPDPRGGPPWAVRIYESVSGGRCAAVGRTSGATAFGPSDAKGRVQDTPASFSGSCAEPGSEAGTGDPRAVRRRRRHATLGAVRLRGTGGRNDRGERTGAARRAAVALDTQRTFLVVHEGLSVPDSWLLTATLNDGSTRSYRR